MSQPEEFRDFVLNHQFDQLAKGQDGRAIIFLEEDEYQAMQSIMAEAASPGSLNAALELLADIRAAAGDPDGKMMQTELVQHIAEIRERAELWGQESDHFRDGTKMIQGNVQSMGDLNFNDEDNYRNALVIEFSSREEFAAALESGQCRFTVFGGEV